MYKLKNNYKYDSKNNDYIYKIKLDIMLFKLISCFVKILLCTYVFLMFRNIEK